MFFVLIKELNSLISKEYQTFTIKDNWSYQNFDFLGKKIWRNALVLKSKEVQGIFEERFILVFSS